MLPTRSRWTEPIFEEALERCRLRNSQGIKCTVALLANAPRNLEQANDGLRVHLAMVRLLAQQRVESSVTLKPTVVGALLDMDFCLESLLTLSNAAQARGVAVEIATEGKSLVPDIVDAAVACAGENENVTLDLQAYLDRTPKDVDTAVRHGVKVRLVKGAYAGDTADFSEIQRRFMSLAELILKGGQPLLLGTHDPDLVQWAKQQAVSDRSRVEFGFLMGLADQTKLDLAGQGWRVREYVPFGENSEAYVRRRESYLQDLEKMGRAALPVG
ncbi:MAG: proline dehydrogenase family protein [Candidatus Bathyarchaeia archaeon]